ncbi:MAG: hypothetical protein QFF03_22890 [Pseudomonadota bacterium]|nr:hypothetical protein [Pseudomonadota bacterium]
MQASSKFKVKRVALLAALTMLAACLQAALIVAAREPTADALCGPGRKMRLSAFDMAAPAPAITPARAGDGVRTDGK